MALPGRGVTALFGPSGSGKTTCLRAIAGLERVPGGHVSLGEQVASHRVVAEVVAEVVTVAHAWQAHFAQMGVSAPDVAVLAQAIDRPFLHNQRLTWLQT